MENLVEVYHSIGAKEFLIIAACYIGSCKGIKIDIRCFLGWIKIDIGSLLGRKIIDMGCSLGRIKIKTGSYNNELLSDEEKPSDSEG